MPSTTEYPEWAAGEIVEDVEDFLEPRSACAAAKMKVRIRQQGRKPPKKHPMVSASPKSLVGIVPMATCDSTDDGLVDPSASAVGQPSAFSLSPGGSSQHPPPHPPSAQPTYSSTWRPSVSGDTARSKGNAATHRSSTAVLKHLLPVTTSKGPGGPRSAPDVTALHTASTAARYCGVRCAPCAASISSSATISRKSSPHSPPIQSTKEAPASLTRALQILASHPIPSEGKGKDPIDTAAAAADFNCVMETVIAPNVAAQHVGLQRSAPPPRHGGQVSQHQATTTCFTTDPHLQEGAGPPSESRAQRRCTVMARSSRKYHAQGGRVAASSCTELFEVNAPGSETLYTTEPCAEAVRLNRTDAATSVPSRSSQNGRRTRQDAIPVHTESDVDGDAGENPHLARLHGDEMLNCTTRKPLADTPTSQAILHPALCSEYSIFGGLNSTISSRRDSFHANMTLPTLGASQTFALKGSRHSIMQVPRVPSTHGSRSRSTLSVAPPKPTVSKAPRIVGATRLRLLTSAPSFAPGVVSKPLSLERKPTVRDKKESDTPCSQKKREVRGVALGGRSLPQRAAERQGGAPIDFDAARRKRKPHGNRGFRRRSTSFNEV